MMIVQVSFPWLYWISVLVKVAVYRLMNINERLSFICNSWQSNARETRSDASSRVSQCIMQLHSAQYVHNLYTLNVSKLSVLVCYTHCSLIPAVFLYPLFSYLIWKIIHLSFRFNPLTPIVAIWRHTYFRHHNFIKKCENIQKLSQIEEYK